MVGSWLLDGQFYAKTLFCIQQTDIPTFYTLSANMSSFGMQSMWLNWMHNVKFWNGQILFHTCGISLLDSYLSRLKQSMYNDYKMMIFVFEFHFGDWLHVGAKCTLFISVSYNWFQHVIQTSLVWGIWFLTCLISSIIRRGCCKIPPLVGQRN